jgi:ABC-2 type transport system ATP-binding protein
MLELRSVSKQFSGIAVVDKVSFLARPGEITGYLGPNRSGKSTAMKMITGLIEMTSGQVLLDGTPIQHDLIADDSIERLRSIMDLPSLEAIFSELAVEQDSDTIARQIADLIHA